MFGDNAGVAGWWKITYTRELHSTRQVAMLNDISYVTRTWSFICSVYNFDRFNMDGKLTLEKPNTDEHICIKDGLIRDPIGYSMHERQDNNVKKLINYVCTE